MQVTSLSRASGSINPTLLLFGLSVPGFYLSSWLAIRGELSMSQAAIINTVMIYAMYTVMHDAAHHIAHRSKWLNNLMGRICAFHEGITFPLFRLSHMQHHRYTNHPEKDPDYVIGRKPRWLFPVWVMVRLLHDNTYMIKHKLWRRPALIEHIITVGLQATGILVLAEIVGWSAILWLWIVPMVVAGALVEILVAWLVHYPHESMSRFENTRLFKSRLLQVLMLNHNLHLVHHVWPWVPWYQYGSRLGELEGLLKQKTN